MNGMESLSYQVQDASRNCASISVENLPFSTDVVRGNVVVALVAGVLCACASWTLLGIQIFRVTKYPRFRSRTWIGRHLFIFFLFPAVTSCHLLAAFVPRAMILCQFVANTFISAALVVFFFQVIAYFGNEERMLLQMQGTHVVQPICCRCSCCPQQDFNGLRLSRIRKLTLQYSFIQPATGFLGAVLAANGSFTPGSLSFTDSYLYLQVVGGISLVICLQSLTRLNLTTKKFINEQFRSSAKFIFIWIVLLLTNAQLLVFSIAGDLGAWKCTELWGRPGLSAWYQHFAAIYEMGGLSVLVHFYAFPSDLSLDKPSSLAPVCQRDGANDDDGLLEEQPLLSK